MYKSRTLQSRNTSPLSKFCWKYVSLILFFVLLLFNILFTKNFVSWITLSNLIRQSSKIVLVALGMTLVIATGGIDISVGSAMALGALLSALGLLYGQWWMILLSLIVVVAFGALAGVSVSMFGILPMVVTLALRYVMRGMAKGISGVGTITYNCPALTGFFTRQMFGVIPIHLVILIAAIIITYIIVNRMKFGAYVEAYGNNNEAARICGINTVKIVVTCYCVCALFSWCAGMLDMISVSSANPATIGRDYDVDAIAAVLVGGTPVVGGYPNIIGTVGGALVLQLLNMMCNMHNIPYAITLMIKGVVILMALFFHGMRHRKN